MDQKRSKKLKRIVSGLLSLTMITTSMSAVLPASADEASKQEAYPYAIFAADEQGGIKLDLNYLTVNGNACTNGVYSTTAKNSNINGTISENEFIADEIVTDDENTTDSQDGAKAFDVSRDMIYIHNKLITSWFNNSRNFDNDYTLSEMNINLNSPVYVTGKMSYNGNVALNTAIGAVSDVTLSGGNLNGNNAVIYSKFGDIKIDDSQASMNGLIYAPFGTVTIDCDNFNLNGLIIAQNVVINSNIANINYSNTWAEFVGTDTEKLSWTFDDWKYLADTDKDGLPNLIEKEIGTKPYDADTDGDLLPDGYEIFTLFTNPKKADTDGNGVSDYDEDFDNDGLSNGREYEIGTLPSDSDTDGDNLKDGDEVNTYFTDPLEVDTDKDGLNDDDEIYFSTDPNDPDTDDNGILDGAEKRSQTFIHKVKNEDCAITEVIVSMEGTGNLQKTTTVDSIMNRDMLCTDVVGLVGEPFSIETTSKFDKATLTFKIDQSKLGDTNFDDLLFLWHDEENHNFAELDTIFDEANSTVSIETTHFSKYMVVDKYKWFDAWSMQFNYNPGREHVGENYAGYDKNLTVMTIDCSGSMSSNDPIGIRSSINSAYDAQFTKTCGRISAGEEFITFMMGDDLTSIVLFDNYAFDTLAMTDDKEKLRLGLQKVCDRNGTEFLPAIKSSLEMFTEDQLNDTKANKRIILLSDGYDFYPAQTKSYLNNLYNQHNPDVRNNVKIYTIALGRGADTEFLEEIANLTGGEAYKAYTASELVDIYSEIGIGGDFDTTDTDGDGLYDAVEAAGIRMQNGKIIFTDPTNDDSDYDGLKDGEEIDPTPRHSNVTTYNSDGTVNTVKGYYFVMKSDSNDEDSDGDGLTDEFEEIIGTKILDTDSDGDTLSDGYEIELWYDPTNSNPDNDTYDDAEELENETSPFVYDLNAKEKAIAIAKGFFLGDFVSPDNIEILVGQVAGSFVPLGADARDYFANVFVNLDTGAALLNVGGFVLDFIPIAGSAGDAAKAFPRIAKFVAKYADDAPKVIEAIIQTAKKVPNSDEVIIGVAKALPVGAVDDIFDSVKNGAKLTKAEYSKLIDLYKAAGKSSDELIEVTKFNSFKALKDYLGDPGNNKQWHHIVEQCQAKATRSNFDVSDINKVSNVKATPNDVHKDISAFYSSKQPFTNGKTVRDWLNGQSFEDQYKFGIEQWEKFMKQHGYSID